MNITAITIGFFFTGTAIGMLVGWMLAMRALRLDRQRYEKRIEELEDAAADAASEGYCDYD